MRGEANHSTTRSPPHRPHQNYQDRRGGERAAAEILSFFFSREAASLRAEAIGGGTSRLYDGTHWRFDVEVGLEIGRAIAPFFINRARHDGAHPSR
jgi:hypothetical protein